MVDKIKEVLAELTFLSPEDMFNLARILRLKQVKKGEHVVREGEYNYQSMKVIKGLLSHYVIDEDGFEKTLLFVPEGRFSGSLKTTMNREPADENIVALENTLVMATDIRELEKLAANNVRIMKMLNESYKRIIADSAERIKFLIAHSHEERYLNFCKNYPQLEQRIKQKDLASYLGITDSSLSRIRARIANR